MGYTLYGVSYIYDIYYSEERRGDGKECGSDDGEEYGGDDGEECGGDYDEKCRSDDDKECIQ